MDVGEVIDETEIPLHYCARFLVSAFLLENQNSKKIRVSVLSLTLNSLSQIFRIYPRIGGISVERNGSVYESTENICLHVLFHSSSDNSNSMYKIFSDYNDLLQVILCYSTHEDQQVRGLVCVTIGSFIVSSLIDDNYLLKETSYLNESFLNELLEYLLKVNILQCVQ